MGPGPRLRLPRGPGQRSWARLQPARLCGDSDGVDPGAGPVAQQYPG